MKRAAIAAVAALVLAFAAPAGATTQKLTPAEKSLQRQVTALQAQVKTLSKQVTTLKKQVTTATQIGAAALTFSVCSTAATADTLRPRSRSSTRLPRGPRGRPTSGRSRG